MKTIRRDAIVGIYEGKTLEHVTLHFSEWWNGEGADFTFGNDKKRISLSIDEMHAVSVAFLLLGMVDKDEVNDEVEKIQKDSSLREEMINQLREHME